MKRRANQPIVTDSLYGRISTIAVLIVLVTGCSRGEMTDLEAYVAEIKARENPSVEPIPPFDIAPGHFYEVDNMRDPFIPVIGADQKQAQSTEVGNTLLCPQPDQNRVRIGLETQPLDSLSMVGILQQADGTLWGLIESKTDGTIYKVRTGDYMGTNYGEVINITENRIELLEWYPDGKGCWLEQTTPLAVASE